MVVCVHEGRARPPAAGARAPRSGAPGPPVAELVDMYIYIYIYTYVYIDR